MSNLKIISMKELTKLIGVARATIYRWMDNGTFPLSIKLSSGKVGWRENEIEDWLASRPRTSGVNRKHQDLLNKVLK